MANIDDAILTKAIKDKIGGGEMNIFIEETIATKTCEMFEKLKKNTELGKSLLSGVIILANNAINTYNLGAAKGGKRRTRKLKK